MTAVSVPWLSEQQQGSGRPGDLYHVATCHDDDLALCGTDVSDLTFGPMLPGDVECIVCAEMEALDCADAEGYCTCLCCEVFL